MNILVNVVNQRLKIATNLNSIVAGTQEFIRFIFKLQEDWDNLTVFAQFIQNDTAYNIYLDSDNSVYLPSEIVQGTVDMLLYGSGDEVIATTNYITFTIDENRLIQDAQSTEITLSLYNQLVNMVKNVSYQLPSLDEDGIISFSDKGDEHGTETDTTLTIPGVPADSKAVGDALALVDVDLTFTDNNRDGNIVITKG